MISLWALLLLFFAQEPQGGITVSGGSGGGSTVSTPTFVQSVDCSQLNGNPINQASTYFYCIFPQPTLGGSGDIIVAGFVQDNTTRRWSVCDGSSNTCASSTNSYTYVTTSDSNGELSVMAYTVNDRSVRTIIFACGSTCANFRAPWVAEWSGVGGGFDKSSAGVSSNSTTVTAGSTTPAVTGELVVQQALNDYIGGYTAASSTFTAGSQSNITWQLGLHDDYVPFAVQYGVYSSTTALNPTMSENTSGFISQALFFKPGTGPAPPTTIYPNALKHVWFQVSTSPNVIHFACPSADTAALYEFVSGPTTDDATAITINSHSMTQTHAKLVGSTGIIHNYYVQNTTLSPSQTVSITGSFTGGAPNSWVYCLANANTSSFQQAVQTSGTQTTSQATLSTVSITPGASGNLLFASGSIANNTIVGLTGTGQYYVTDFWSSSVGNSGQMDQGNPAGWMVAPSTSSQTFVWNLFFTTSDAVGTWLVEADEFK